jgi:hypothetical protein
MGRDGMEPEAWTLGVMDGWVGRASIVPAIWGLTAGMAFLPATVTIIWTRVPTLIYHISYMPRSFSCQYPTDIQSYVCMYMTSTANPKPSRGTGLTSAFSRLGRSCPCPCSGLDAFVRFRLRLIMLGRVGPRLRGKRRVAFGNGYV